MRNAWVKSLNNLVTLLPAQSTRAILTAHPNILWTNWYESYLHNVVCCLHTKLFLRNAGTGRGSSHKIVANRTHSSLGHYKWERVLEYQIYSEHVIWPISATQQVMWPGFRDFLPFSRSWSYYWLISAQYWYSAESRATELQGSNKLLMLKDSYHDTQIHCNAVI